MQMHAIVDRRYIISAKVVPFIPHRISLDDVQLCKKVKWARTIPEYSYRIKLSKSF